MDFETACVSLIGNRNINQDRCVALQDDCCALLLLADGMGGHPKGEVAAQILIDTGRTAFATRSRPIVNPRGFLEDILRAAHEEILGFGRDHRPPIDPRAAAVAALVQNDTLYWIHSGDSRLYLFRNYQVLVRTRDHSLVEEMRNRGIPSDDGRIQQRYRNLVTQCLGGTGMRFATSHGRPTRLLPRDVLLLCSDGLWSQFADHELGAQMRHHGSLERMTTELARAAALAAAPASDNISLIALRWLGRDHRAEAVPPTTATATATETQPVAPADQELSEAIAQLRAAIDEYGEE
jgi:serine/threonine protein phosphatase PrpC